MTAANVQPVDYQRTVVTVRTDDPHPLAPNNLHQPRFEWFEDCTWTTAADGSLAVLAATGETARSYEAGDWMAAYLIDRDTTTIPLLPLFAEESELAADAIVFYQDRIRQFRDAPNITKDDNWQEEQDQIEAAQAGLADPMRPEAPPLAWHRLRIAVQSLWMTEQFTDPTRLAALRTLDAALAPYSPPE